VYEAEAAQRQGALVQAENTGYTGSGYVDFGAASGEWLQWNVNVASAGLYMLSFRYSLGKAETRSMGVDVNGQAVRSLAFTGTGTWATWKTLKVQIALQAGQNTIRISTTGTNGPNVDSLTVA
jgi:hypothetical protein